jgi:hypothetical protein
MASYDPVFFRPLAKPRRSVDVDIAGLMAALDLGLATEGHARFVQRLAALNQKMPEGIAPEIDPRSGFQRNPVARVASELWRGNVAYRFAEPHLAHVSSLLKTTRVVVSAL